MSQFKRLSYLLALNSAMIAGLITVGLASHSIAVIAAGGDFIADSCAILLGLIAVHLRDTHNRRNAPIFVALINASLLVVITAFVMTKAAIRLAGHTPEIHGMPVLIISLISTLVMILGVFILGKGAGNEDLHMRSVLLDTVADGLAAASVAVVGAVILLTGRLFWLDSLVALVIGAVIGYGAIKLLKDVVKSLRSGAPVEIAND